MTAAALTDCVMDHHAIDYEEIENDYDYGDFAAGKAALGSV